MLYPLSYEGGGCAVACAKLADEPRTGDLSLSGAVFGLFRSLPPDGCRP